MRDRETGKLHLDGPYPIPEHRRGRLGFAPSWRDNRLEPAREFQEGGTPQPDWLAESPTIATVRLTDDQRGRTGTALEHDGRTRTPARELQEFGTPTERFTADSPTRPDDFRTPVFQVPAASEVAASMTAITLAPLLLDPAPVREDKPEPAPVPRPSPDLTPYGDPAGFEAACRCLCTADGGDPESPTLIVGVRGAVPFWRAYSHLISRVLAAYDAAKSLAAPAPKPRIHPIAAGLALTDDDFFTAVDGQKLWLKLNEADTDIIDVFVKGRLTPIFFIPNAAASDEDINKTWLAYKTGRADGEAAAAWRIGDEIKAAFKQLGLEFQRR